MTWPNDSGLYRRAPKWLRGFAWLAEFCIRFLTGRTITLKCRRSYVNLGVFRIDMLDLTFISKEWKLNSRIMAVARERMATYDNLTAKETIT